MNPDRLWLRFVRLSLLCALLPGFGLATLMVSARMWSVPAGLWSLAAIQTHASALIMGWGAAMILGVALHFLPRLRGVKLAHPGCVNVLFWFLAAGLTCRVVGQPLLAALAPSGSGPSVAWLNGVIAAGVAFTASALVGITAVLFGTFRAGPPLDKNKGFKQVAPLLALAALALIVAQLVLCWGAGGVLMKGGSLSVLPVLQQAVAVDLLLYGFVAAGGIAMSSRLFPLTFRTQLPHPRGLQIAAALLAGGVILTSFGVFDAVPASVARAVQNGASVLFAGGLLSGAWAVRIFHARKPITGARNPYRVWEDPAAVGVWSAYAWTGVAAALLLLPALREAGATIPVELLQKNLPRHALGVGYMTLLILSVGWKMLPGFGGGQPRGRPLLWSAVLLGNLAGVLRILPAVIPAQGNPGESWGERLFPFAGLAGLAAVAAFALALHDSFRKPPVSPLPGSPPSVP